MPTTTEVEARLRRTAAACEPLVEDLLDHDATMPHPVTADRPVRRRRTAWLVAAAALAVALGIGTAVAVTTDDEAPTDDVAAGPEGVGLGGTVPAPPGEGLLLPDGSRIEVTIPGPRTWEPDDQHLGVLLDLAGLPDPRSASLRRGTIADLAADDIVVERELGEGRALVVENKLHSIAVAHDGWVMTVDVATDYGEDEDLPPDAIDALARGMAFDVTPEGPIAVRGPGVTVTSGSRSLRATDGTDDRVRIQWGGGNPVEDCAHQPPPWRCFADDTVLVQAEMADGAAGEALVAGITVDGVRGVEVPAPTESMDLALPSRDDLEIGLPTGLGWQVLEVVAPARLDGDEAEHTVSVTPIAEAADRGPVVVDQDATTVLLLERGGWRVTLPLARDGVDLVARDRWDGLRTSLQMTPTPEGVSEVAADGLTLDGATVVLGPPDGTAGRVRIELDRDTPEPCAPAADTRCLYDGQLVAVGEGEAGLEVLGELWLRSWGSHS